MIDRGEDRVEPASLNQLYGARLVVNTQLLSQSGIIGACTYQIILIRVSLWHISTNQCNFKNMFYPFVNAHYRFLYLKKVTDNYCNNMFFRRCPLPNASKI